MMELADRVIALYWRQREPFPAAGGALVQVKHGDSALLGEVDRLRGAVAREFGAPALWRARMSRQYPRVCRRVAQLLAQMPLTHLQRTGLGGGSDAFLYDDSWLHKKINQAELAAHGWRIVLRPGIAAVLAELGPLLVPVIEREWQQEVRRLNSDSLSEEALLEVYLFGMSRVSLDAVRDPLLELQRGRCFYCDAKVRAAHVDHVLPWSRTGLDSLSNLVVCDERCNVEKSDQLPVPGRIGAALGRPELPELSEQLQWPLEADLVRVTARGLFATMPLGARLWAGRGQWEPLTEAARRRALAALS